MDRGRVYVVARSGRKLALRWLDDGVVRECSSGTRDRRKAERLAKDLERRLARGDVHAATVGWAEFCDRVEVEHFGHLSRSSQGMWLTTRNHVDRILAPQTLDDLSPSRLTQWASRLAATTSASSVRAYWRTLRSALSWAQDVGLLADVPTIRLPRGASAKRRARAVTGDEFLEILAAVPQVRPHDAERWQRFLRGLWHSGLRAEELRRLRWEPEADVALLDVEPFPLIRFLGSGQKNRQEQLQPITPEFWQLCQGMERKGYVFLLGEKTQMSAKRVLRTISDIGKASGVVTDSATGKFASSHDIGRRAFLTRMDGKLTLAELQKWARHSSIATTLTYYHSADAAALAAKVWRRP